MEKDIEIKKQVFNKLRTDLTNRVLKKYTTNEEFEQLMAEGNALRRINDPMYAFGNEKLTNTVKETQKTEGNDLVTKVYADHDILKSYFSVELDRLGNLVMSVTP